MNLGQYAYLSKVLNERSPLSEDRLYQMNFQFFPWA